MNTENQKETLVRQALEAHLVGTGEQLLAYTRGNLIGVTSQPYYVGLTGERWVMMPLKRNQPAGPVYSLWRDTVQSVKNSSGLWQRRLVLQAANENLTLVCSGQWNKRAKELAEQAALPPVSFTSPALQQQRALQQARDFQSLGLLAAAQRQMDEAVQANPMLGVDPVTVALKAVLADARLALRVGALFSAGNIALLAIIAGLLTLVSGPQAAGQMCSSASIGSLVIDAIIAVNLWQGREQWRSWALVRAVLGLLLYGIVAIGQSDWVSLISQAAYSGAFIILFAGQSKRWKTWTAVAVYSLGYVGFILLFLIGSFVVGMFR